MPFRVGSSDEPSIGLASRSRSSSDCKKAEVNEPRAQTIAPDRLTLSFAAAEAHAIATLGDERLPIDQRVGLGESELDALPNRIEGHDLLFTATARFFDRPDLATDRKTYLLLAWGSSLMRRVAPPPEAAQRMFVRGSFENLRHEFCQPYHGELCANLLEAAGRFVTLSHEESESLRAIALTQLTNPHRHEYTKIRLAIEFCQRYTTSESEDVPSHESHAVASQVVHLLQTRADNVDNRLQLIADTGHVFSNDGVSRELRAEFIRMACENFAQAPSSHKYLPLGIWKTCCVARETQTPLSMGDVVGLIKCGLSSRLSPAIPRHVDLRSYVITELANFCLHEPYRSMIPSELSKAVGIEAGRRAQSPETDPHSVPRLHAQHQALVPSEERVHRDGRGSP